MDRVVRALLALLDLSVDELLEKVDVCFDIEDGELLDLRDELNTADLRVDVREVQTLNLVLELEVSIVLTTFDV